MTTTSFYRTRARDAEIRLYYDDALFRLGIPYQSQYVDTRFGETHMIAAGPEDAPPLILLHGIYDNAPSNLKKFLPLTEKFRVYALDTIGQSVRSAPNVISTHDDSYGCWIKDVLDALNLRQAAFTGLSLGGGILLRAAALIPERISAAAMVNPSGVIFESVPKLATQFLLPWSRYMLSPTYDNMVEAARPIFSEMDEHSLDYMFTYLRSVNITPEEPRVTRAKELKNFTAPTLIFTAQNDCFFPSQSLERQAHKIFPNLVAVKHIHGKHVPAKKSMVKVNEQIVSFLENPALMRA